MKIQNNTKNTFNAVQTADKPPKKEASKYIYQAEINITDGSLKLITDRKNWHDAKRVYFVNKDGSARVLSAWSTKDFPKGTFLELFNKVQKTCNEKQSTVLTEDEIKAFIDEFENTVDE